MKLNMKLVIIFRNDNTYKDPNEVGHKIGHTILVDPNEVGHTIFHNVLFTLIPMKLYMKLTIIYLYDIAFYNPIQISQ